METGGGSEFASVKQWRRRPEKKERDTERAKEATNRNARDKNTASRYKCHWADLWLAEAETQLERDVSPWIF